MKSSHQLVALGIGVFVSLGQASPAVSQATHKAIAPVPAGGQTTPEQPRSPAAEAVPASSPDAAQVNTATSGNKDNAPDTPRSPAASTAAPATPADNQPTAAAPVPAPTTAERSPEAKPAAPSPATPAKPVPLVKPVNLADFKKAQNSPTPNTALTPAAPATPSSPPVAPVDGGLPGSKPIGPAKPGAAPEYLNSNPNPLTIPTRPEDAKVRGIQPITLKQALELAKRNNRDYQIAALQLERSRAALRQAQAALYPTVATQANITQSQSATGELQQRAAEAARANVPRALRNAGNNDRANLVLNGAVELSYNIYTGGQRPANIRAAEQQVRADQLQVEIAEYELRLNVANGYYDLQEADEAVRIQQAAVRNAEASLRDTQALERAGLGTRFDVLRAQVQLANSQQALTNALSAQRTRRRELARLLAVPVYLDLAAADAVAIAGSWTMDLPQTLTVALKNRAELEQQLALREQAEQRRKAALGALKPQVQLQVQYNVLDNLRDQIGFVDGYSAGAGMTWNLFDGGNARAQAQQQEVNKALAETRFAQARESIQLQVETSFNGLQSSFLNIGTNRQAVAQAREALRLARLRFQAGVGTQTDVINAENDLTRAEGNLVNAILGYNRALASLERAVTNLPIPTGSTTPSIPGAPPPLPPEPTF